MDEARVRRGVRGMQAGLVLVAVVAALGLAGAVGLAVEGETALASATFGFTGLLLTLSGILYSSGRQALEAAGVWRKQG